MYIIRYIKQNGLRHVFKVLYRYKINQLLIRIVYLFTKKKPLLDIIVIKSHNDFDCNGGAFYNYLIKNQYNEKYKIVWRLEHKNIMKLPYNVCAVNDCRPSIRRAFYLCRATYLLCDSGVLEKIRDDQLSYYFTHSGVAIKNVKRFMKMTKSLDFCLSPSKNYDAILRDQKNLSDNTELLHLGFPFNDILFEEI